MEKELEDSEDLIMTSLGVTRCDEVEEAESRCVITSSVYFTVLYTCTPGL